MFNRFAKVALAAASLTTLSILPSAADPIQGRALTFSKPAAVRNHLSALQKTDALPGGRYGYVLIDAQSGAVISGRNEDALFIPASLAKIPTTLMALSHTGMKTQFKTRLLADGPIVDGTLRGDLTLVGSGDPSLRTHDLVELASYLSSAGIKRVKGRFLYNAEAIPTTSRIDMKQSLGQHYNPAVSGLNLNHNLNSRRVPIKQPAGAAARLFRKIAKRNGVILPEPKRSTTAPQGDTIGTHHSAPVKQIITRMMKKSTNLTAEALGAIAASSLGHEPASLADASRMTSDWLITESGSIGGSEWGGFELVNHSGLSSRSRATPRQMAAILRMGYLRFGETFVDLHKRTAPAGHQAYDLHGKIGTMRFVRGYGGFLTVGGRDMIFTIMANDDHRRALADAGKSGLASSGWMTRARKLEYAILSDWIAEHWTGTAVAAVETQPVPIASPEPAPQPVAEAPLIRVSIPNQTATYVRSTSLVE